jgi:hypothetical protein
MDRSQAMVRTALRVAVLLIAAGAVGCVVLALVAFHSLQEPYPYFDVHNESGRPLLIEQVDTAPAQATPGTSLLAWRTKEGWPASGHGCEDNQLVARDLDGSVLARHTGDCGSDSWTISAEGLPAAPRYQPEPLTPERVEVRAVLDPYQDRASMAAWWRELPQALRRATAAGDTARVGVDGPFVEGGDLVMYLRGPDAATVLQFFEAQGLGPLPGRVYAYVGAPGQPAPRTARPTVVTATTAP